MYTEFYKFSGRPFNLTPDHRFFYGSQTHKRAMAYLVYGLNAAEGFVVVTGDIGTGKSTLVDHLLSLIDGSQYVAAKVVTTQIDANDTLRMVASAFGIQQEGADKATLLRRLESFLISSHKAGRRILLFIDESQNLPAPSLEELRMLSNIQISGVSPLQVFLLGQPQFRNTLGREDLVQLRQRVIASHHLAPMDAGETRSYVEHRLHLVGWNNDPEFMPEAFSKIYEYTSGVPRQINLLCSRILMYGMLEGQHRITGDTVERVRREMMEEIALDPRPLPGQDAAGNNGQRIREGGTEADRVLAIEARVDKLEKRMSVQHRLMERTLGLAAQWMEMQAGDGDRPENGGKPA